MQPSYTASYSTPTKRQSLLVYAFFSLFFQNFDSLIADIIRPTGGFCRVYSRDGGSQPTSTFTESAYASIIC